MAVVLFSFYSELSIKFTDHTNANDFKRAVDALRLMRSTTRIDRALKTAYNEMFNEKNGMRVTVPKVLILLTDGEQTKGADAVPPEQVVQKFHDAGIKVIVIGIGKGVNSLELGKMVKSRENLYLAKDFDQLKSGQFVDNIIGSTCLETGMRSFAALLYTKVTKVVVIARQQISSLYFPRTRHMVQAVIIV